MDSYYIQVRLNEINNLLEIINANLRPWLDDWEFELVTNKLYVDKKVANRDDKLQLVINPGNEQDILKGVDKE